MSQAGRTLHCQSADCVIFFADAWHPAPGTDLRRKTVSKPDPQAHSMQTTIQRPRLDSSRGWRAFHPARCGSSAPIERAHCSRAAAKMFLMHIFLQSTALAGHRARRGRPRFGRNASSALTGGGGARCVAGRVCGHMVCKVQALPLAQHTITSRPSTVHVPCVCTHGLPCVNRARFGHS